MIDILLDTDFDLLIESGDFVLADATEQHQQLLIITNKGEWKEDPTIAVGVHRSLKGEGPQELLGEIKSEFEKDGMEVQKIELSGDSLFINAPYR